MGISSTRTTNFADVGEAPNQTTAQPLWRETTSTKTKTKMNTTLATTANGAMPLARPLKKLSELIASEIAEMLKIEQDEMASMRERIEQRVQVYRLSIGEKLLEAKRQSKHGEFQNWVKANFTTPYDTLGDWMRMAKAQKLEPSSFSSGRQFKKQQREKKTRSKTAAESKTKARQTRERNRIKLEDFMSRANWENFERSVLSGSTLHDHELIVKIATEIVNVGYRSLATKMHPDKGGSTDGMQRLTEARDFLRRALQ